MAEHDSDREKREDREGREEREEREPDEQGVPIDEEAVWAAIVAGYGDEPPDPPGAKPFKPVEDLALPEAVFNPAPRGEPAAALGPEVAEAESDAGDAGDVAEAAGAAEKPEPEPTPPAGAAEPPSPPLGSSVSFAPGVGPRDYTVREPDEDDEGHFVPPEPPPLPSGDTTARFAWLGVIGGPVLLLLAVLFSWDMTWWLTTLGVGGFLGGFVTLVARMNPDDEDDGDPGRGAVV